MGYFSNGTEGEIYEEQYCSRCIHGPENDSPGMCPIWSLHLLWNYEQNGSDPPIQAKKMALDILIPRKGIHNQECSMFVQKT